MDVVAWTTAHGVRHRFTSQRSPGVTPTFVDVCLPATARPAGGSEMNKTVAVGASLAMLVVCGSPSPAFAEEPKSVAEAVEKGADLWETMAATRLYQLPHAGSKVVTRIGKAVPLVVLLNRTDWMKVLTEKGDRGWVATVFLRKVSSGSAPTLPTPPATQPQPVTPRKTPASSTATPPVRVPLITAPVRTGAKSPVGALKLEKDRFVTPIDFCDSAAGSAGRTDRFVRQKLLLFRMTAAENAKMSGPGSAACEEHVAELFQAVFPMKRFDNIVSPTRVPTALLGKDTVALSSLEEELRKQSPFVAYSLKCADYLAVPVLRRCTGEFTSTKASNGREVKTYDAKVETEMVIWRRYGDELRHHTTISADAPTIANRASDIAQAAQAQMVQAAKKSGGKVTGKLFDMLVNLANPLKVLEFVSFISPIPENTCLASGTKKPKEDQGCQVSINNRVLPFAQPMVEIRKCLFDPPDNPDEAWLIKCGVRNRAEQVAFNLQKEARGVDGWRLWAAIKDSESEGVPRMVLGREEGVYVGEIFHAVERQPDGSRVRHGFAKVLTVGAGGDAGDFKPSTLRWRAGTGGPNLVFEEHPQLGLSVGLGGDIGVLLVPPALVDQKRNLYFNPGTVYGGGRLHVGYDLSGVTRWPEFWVLTNVGFVMAFGEAINTMLLDIQLFAEKRIYLGRRLDWFFGFGPSMVQAFLSLKKVQGVAEGTSAKAFTIGIAAETGFDLALTADLYLRLGVLWRQHFKEIEEFDTDSGTWRPGGSWNGDPFSTTFSGMVVNLGAHWVF